MWNPTLAAKVAIAFTIGMAHTALAQESFVVDEMVVVLIDGVNVPANESGVIAELLVREGNSVKSGQLLAQLDDRKAKLEEALTRTQFAIATKNAESGLATKLAEKKLDQQRQLAKEHALTKEIAEQKAANEVRVLASTKAAKVAENELERASQARQEYVDSVSQSEIDNLRFAYERTVLETEQAKFERRMDGLHAKAEAEVATGHQHSVDHATIEVAQAVADQQIHELQVELQQHQSQLAALATSRRRIVAPIDGVVVERFLHTGDWVNAGDPVVRVIRLNRLRAEGFVSANRMGALKENQKVRLIVRRDEESTIELEGAIVFVSPEIDPINNEVRFWVEFDNPNREVLPGMRLSMRLEP